MKTIADKLRQSRVELTHSERLFADVILEDANLDWFDHEPVQPGGVSTATVVRFVKKWVLTTIPVAIES